MASAFNSNEFENLIKELSFSHMAVNSHLDAIKVQIEWAASNYLSTDSNLGGTFSELTEILSNLRISCDDVLAKLQESLIAYMNETIENEKQSSREVQSETDIIDSISANIGKIA